MERELGAERARLDDLRESESGIRFVWNLMPMDRTCERVSPMDSRNACRPADAEYVAR